MLPGTQLLYSIYYYLHDQVKACPSHKKAARRVRIGTPTRGNLNRSDHSFSEPHKRSPASSIPTAIMCEEVVSNVLCRTCRQAVIRVNTGYLPCGSGVLPPRNCPNWTWSRTHDTVSRVEKCAACRTVEQMEEIEKSVAAASKTRREAKK